jgi:isoleucyl-tRNA synthetase
VGLVTDELNVRSLRAVTDLEKYVTITAVPNFPVLGKKFGKRVPAIAAAIKLLGTTALSAFMSDGVARVELDGEAIELGREDLSVRVAPLAGYGASEERGLTVILNLNISDELRVEGSAREVINRLQNLRKSAGLDVVDRIRIRYAGGAQLRRVFESQGALIAARRSPMKCRSETRIGTMKLRSSWKVNRCRCGFRNLVDRGGRPHYLTFALETSIISVNNRGQGVTRT